MQNHVGNTGFFNFTITGNGGKYEGCTDTNTRRLENWF